MLERIFPQPMKPFFRLVAFAALWWAVIDSYPLWKAATAAGSSPSLYVSFGLALVFLFEAMLLLASVFTGARVFKALVVLLSVVGAGAFAFSLLFNAAMSPDMLRNAFETDTREARELLTPQLFGLFAAALLPPLLLAWRTAIPARKAKSRLVASGLALLCVALGAGAALANFQDVSVFMRMQKEARYLIAPVNVLYSAASTLLRDQSADAVKERVPVDKTPALSAAAVSAPRPLILAVVVGETARAASWGLSGYERDTTPELRREGVLNFSDVTACGTATAVSLPCMMSRVGRSHYDRERILSEEALPSLLQRAGASVTWIDNQSGCKGACAGVPTLTPLKDLPPEEAKKLCRGDECFDEALLPYVQRETGERAPVTVLFLHMMGSHGPTYSKRYPEEFAKWGPTCDSANVQSCKATELRNGYDNSIAYTDRTVAEMIRSLKEKKNADTALIYLSDHGESLGEKGLFLHGAPWMMAPDEQVKIPMVLWMSDSFKSRLAVNDACLGKAAREPASQDNLWSTVLGLAQVKSSAYDPKLDLTRACRRED